VDEDLEGLSLYDLIRETGDNITGVGEEKKVALVKFNFKCQTSNVKSNPKPKCQRYFIF
jgi:hypothetical protein